MIEGLQEVEGLRILGPALGQARTGIVAFVSERYSASELAFDWTGNMGLPCVLVIIAHRLLIWHQARNRQVQSERVWGCLLAVTR